MLYIHTLHIHYTYINAIGSVNLQTAFPTDLRAVVLVEMFVFWKQNLFTRKFSHYNTFWSVVWTSSCSVLLWVPTSLRVLEYAGQVGVIWRLAT